MKKTKIVIAGGGFAGLTAATYLDKGLARRSDIEVVLISRENFILFTPMLHEVAAGDLSPSDIINPLRRILRRVKIVQADVQSIDLNTRRLLCSGGVAQIDFEIEFDHLLLALGSETNFFDLPGVSDWAVTMKSLSDAAFLRNRVVALLEEANLQDDPAIRRQLLTFVIAGAGFSGVETAGAINDFVREAVAYYPDLDEELIRVVLVHPGQSVLPELGEELGKYAQRRLCERGVEVIGNIQVEAYNDGSLVRLSAGNSLAAATLIWTAGVKPGPVIASLPIQKERGRVLVSQFLSVPGISGLWAAGDCAAVPVGTTGNFHPPTAQHGLRQGTVAAKNIEAAILGRPLAPFVFRTLGQLASIGHRTGVAMVFGIKFSGFIAWCLWRTVYLLKLPRLEKKLRVISGWTLELLFSREIEQMITLRDVEELTSRLTRIRERTEKEISAAGRPVPDPEEHITLLRGK
ncbi:MAG: NAD(P)/FAD-dependent oxidoreductase [Verrucomicrobia bacterium]|nr:NAD(P)/FAD-dependent oxidoreductase [Verrucomicrobiota bacterium]